LCLLCLFVGIQFFCREKAQKAQKEDWVAGMACARSFD
jgi:hypothetical protein